MLLNISYNDPEVKRRIEKAVGKPFSLQKRWQLGGIGSPKLFMNSFSIDIHNLLILDQKRTPEISLRAVLRVSFLDSFPAWALLRAHECL